MEELNPRQREILTLTVNAHIETKVPVGSRVLAERCHLSLSPASVRHEMGVLEELGYLTHPHTSAGRVPTDKGYRFYASQALQEASIPEDLLYFISHEMERKFRSPESFAEQASHILPPIVEETVLVMAPRLEEETPRVFVEGSRYMVSQPEFQDLRKLQQLMAFLEEKTNLLGFLAHPPEETVHVAIGEKELSKEIWDCALVTSPYFRHGKSMGVIGVLGPRRMPYGRIVGLVRFVAERMSRTLERWSA